MAMGQGSVPRNLSQKELFKLLQGSKQDSDRIEILFELGRTYMLQVNSDRKNYKMDTAAEFFNCALRLSDTLKLKGFWFESTLLVGEAHLNKDDTAGGKKRFFEVAAIYHAKGDVQREARTWLRLARKIAWRKEYTPEIDGYFDKAIKLYTQAGNIEKEAYARSYLTEFLLQTGRSYLMEKELVRIVDINSKIGDKYLAYDYYTLSSLARYRGAYEKALLYATKCVETAEQKKDSLFLSSFYGELALVNDELGRVAESSYWYRKALEKRIDEKDKITILRTARFLIRQLVKLKKNRDALTLMDSLCAVYPPKAVWEKAVVAQCYAYCFDDLQQYPKAEQYFLTMAASYRNVVPDNETYCIANMDIGRFYLQRRQFKKAKGYLDTALANKGADRIIDLRELYQMLFTADSALGNHSAAVKDLRLYELLNDSIYNERKSRQIEELTIQYETQKKEQSIRLLKNEKQLQQNELTKVRNTISWIIGVALLFIVIIGLLVNNARIKQRTNQALQVQQKQIEKKNESLQRLVEEKEWLVREIHHRVKNNFHMVMGLLGTQAAYLKSNEAIQAVAESQQRIQAMSLVHQKLYQSENMSAINMADYIHELVDYLKDSFQTGRKVKFNLQIEPVKLNISHCIPLGLILNEAITNALKHAFPGNREGVIDILLKKTSDDHYLLSVKDNGIGLPPAFNSNKQASMGMKLMRGLSDDLDASFKVNNNGGTEILLNFTDDDNSEQPN
ncbi:histidine kinase dimerization/phosphoacceptor domain -containing protein [Niastella sp. OAS944]|uniref:tetratricopeptide repeat-containing sensor histidine kinase n=1 Tax=Niastella sp. OAS944 TaxID=2664089 RepID=UPI00349884F7|nr:two-component sensor histidine kinase [Chitinophagaceae bacterium OAS944]